jgi:hypothetical protein
LPLGKDPADLIKENVDGFKKVIGKSVHVIEFLLHVLRREIVDDRSFKLKVREEVLPFILLLPSRIDQEHFVAIVAESINSTTEAVRYELNHLREQTEARPVRETSPYGQIAEAAGSVKVVSDVADRLYIFLLAAVQLVDSTLRERLKLELEYVCKIADLQNPSDSDLAGIAFSLEQQFSELPPLAVTEEVVAKLNQLKKVLIRRRLTEYRQILAKAEEEQNDEQFTNVLHNIREYETKLREPAYNPETFLDKKDIKIS